MTLQAQMISYLHSEPQARERKFKARAIVNLLRKNHPSLEGIDKSILIDAINDANSLDRYWRKALEEDETLRGSDYNDKHELAFNKQQELKYETGYHTLKKI